MSKTLIVAPEWCKVAFQADGNLTGKEGFAVTVDGADADLAVKLPDAAGEELIGTILEGGADNSTVIVAVPGPIVMMECGGTVTRGKRVMHDQGDASGAVINASASTSTIGTVGIALATGGDGDQVPVLQSPGAPYNV